MRSEEFLQNVRLFLIKTRFSSSRKILMILIILLGIHFTLPGYKFTWSSSLWNGDKVSTVSALPSRTKSKTTTTDYTNKTMQNRVRGMMVHAWSGYKKYAWGFDELLPISKSGRNWGKYSYLFTPVDSLDTLFLMGLKTEYKECKELVLSTLDFNQEVNDYGNTNHFETTIRILGGLLGAYELDPDQRYIQKAVDLANRLIVTLDENKSGLPSLFINLATGKPSSNTALLV